MSGNKIIRGLKEAVTHARSARTIKVEPHYRGELTKLRCWLTGYKAGHNALGGIPGEDILRQLINAISGDGEP